MSVAILAKAMGLGGLLVATAAGLLDTSSTLYGPGVSASALSSGDECCTCAPCGQVSEPQRSDPTTTTTAAPTDAFALPALGNRLCFF